MSIDRTTMALVGARGIAARLAEITPPEFATPAGPISSIGSQGRDLHAEESLLVRVGLHILAGATGGELNLDCPAGLQKARLAACASVLRKGHDVPGPYWKNARWDGAHQFPALVYVLAATALHGPQICLFGSMSDSDPAATKTVGGAAWREEVGRRLRIDLGEREPFCVGLVPQADPSNYLFCAIAPAARLRIGQFARAVSEAMGGQYTGSKSPGPSPLGGDIGCFVEQAANSVDSQGVAGVISTPSLLRFARDLYEGDSITLCEMHRALLELAYLPAVSDQIH